MEFIMTLLSNYIMFYPILLDLGIVLGRPILLSLDTFPRIMGFAEKISMRPIILQSVDKMPQIQKKLTGANSQGVFYTPTSIKRPNYRERQVLDCLSDLSRTGIFESMACKAVPLVLMEHPSLKELCHQYFVINIEAAAIEDCPIIRPVLQEEELYVALDKINALKRAGNNNVFLYAAQFCHSSSYSRPEWYAKLERTALNLYELDENRQSTDEIPSVFLSTLYHWQKDTHFKSVFLLPNLEERMIKAADSAMYYNEEKQFLYLTETLFQTIIRPLSSTFSLNTIKSCLSENGILMRNEAKHFTRQMSYYNIIGDLCRKRMICLDAAKLILPAEADFVTLCKISMEENNE